MNVLVIDNYDSFVYNLVQYIGEEGAEPQVYRNDKITIQEIRNLKPDAILISPGPGRPEDAKLSLEIFASVARETPTLGVCLGQQCFAVSFGAQVVRADQVMHGKTSLILHDSKGVFHGLTSPLTATRYHSLIVDPTTVPNDLEISAQSADGLIMGLRHRQFPIETVQFHPESVLTEEGHEMIRNFLSGFPKL